MDDDLVSCYVLPDRFGGVTESPGACLLRAFREAGLIAPEFRATPYEKLRLEVRRAVEEALEEVEERVRDGYIDIYD